MKKYLKEIIILIIQMLVFYLYPLFMFEDNPMGFILSIIIITFILSVVFGFISNNKIKYIYPIIISILFIPSVFIYYNSSALVHCLWYFIISYIGIIKGSFLKRINN